MVHFSESRKMNHIPPFCASEVCLHVVNSYKKIDKNSHNFNLGIEQK
ncbi:MAG: hypothetical protein U5L45_16540 [Saprospiraceae bacterium]|nr:hypothetical protein [Saprospiraceae bacterium]